MSYLLDKISFDRLHSICGDHDFVLVATPEYIHKHGAPRTSTDSSTRTVFMYRTPHGVLDWLTLRDGVWNPIELAQDILLTMGSHYSTVFSPGAGSHSCLVGV